jgi:hypothetical protein
MTEQEANAIIRVITIAQEKGMRLLKLPGFEATWSIEQARVAVQNSEHVETREPARPQMSRAETLGEYVIPIGQLKDYKLKEANPGKVKSLLWFLDQKKEQGETISQRAVEFQNNAREYLALMKRTGNG